MNRARRRALLAVGALCLLPHAGRCETPPPFASLRGQPAEALAGRVQPGLGFSLDAAADGEPLPTDGWQLVGTETGKRVLRDARSGLEITRQVRLVGPSGMALVDTTLANTGPSEVTLAGVAVADFSFRVAEGAESLRFRPLSYREDRWYDSTYWTGPDWTRVGKNWHHPGEKTPSIRRFTAPRDGRVRIHGRVFKLHLDGDGVRAAIVFRGQTIWQQELEGKDGRGAEPDLSVAVRTGESIRFLVHKRGHIYCDTTGWDPIVTYDDGGRYQASEAFAACKQGQGGWSYEMQVDGQTNLGLPQLHSLSQDLFARHRVAAVDQAVVFDQNQSLPVCVLSDAADASGVLLALAGTPEWRFRAELTGQGCLRVQSIAPDRNCSLPPGQSRRMPSVLIAPYRGPWLNAVAKLDRVIEAASEEPGLAELRQTFQSALRRVSAALDGAATAGSGGPSRGRRPEFSLAVLVHDDWLQQDKLTDSTEAFGAAVAVQIKRARQLLTDLQDDFAADSLAGQSEQLDRLSRETMRKDLGPEDYPTLYAKVRWLKRRIALANPLMKFGRLLFCKRVPTSYSHLVMQYYGWRARPGGGLFILERPGYSLACRDILDGKLACGNVLEPRPSYDAGRVVFSFVQCEGKRFDPAKIGNANPDDGFYHIYEVNVDGTGLCQLTEGPYDDLMPTYLPDGGIAFCSTRRRGYARCFGGQFSRRWDVYTLHRMAGDGSSIRTLSFHDTNEWFPAVSNTGHILYARWDYIDRDAVTHQTLWASRPDGTNPFAVWGNATTKPHCTFQIQPIPNSTKIIFTAAAHHSICAGPITIVDPSVGNDGQAPLARITPEIPFPEAESRDIKEYYAAPWPLSEKYYLVAYSPKPLVWEPGANPAAALGIYLLDRFGNRELIYRDPQIGSTNPCPLAPRPVPPVLASTVADSEPPYGEMLLADVYQGLGDIPRGSILQLRIVQILPKTTNLADQPPIGVAREENARAILGTVPVEPDGSARFLVPARKPILLQALDADGLAYQTMRSVTYVQPGERVGCVGCHEHRMSTPRRRRSDLLALRRPPSRIDPGPLGGRPFSYVEAVQPVLNRHCIRCHHEGTPEGGLILTGQPEGSFSKSYVALMGDVDFWHLGTNPENAAEALVPRFGGRNQVQVTPPGGMYGALGSRLMKLLRDGHEDVELSADEIRRLAAWIDLNAIFYGVYLPEDQAAQLRGEILPMPQIQ